jgi:ABC-type Fe3+-hydroxamate transport system substrate-binding protein
MRPTRRSLFYCAITIAILVSASTGIFLPGAIAQSLSNKAFPQPKITVEQWQDFLVQVKAKPGIANVSRPETPDVLALADKTENTIYYFTNGGPAHPALAIERVVQNGGTVDIETTGYFAGTEEPFLQWFRQFQDRAAQIRQRFKGGK